MSLHFFQKIHVVYWFQSSKSEKEPLSTKMRVTPFFIGNGISEKGNMFYMVMMTCGLRCGEKMHVVFEITLAICLKYKVKLGRGH